MNIEEEIQLVDFIGTLIEEMWSPQGSNLVFIMLLNDREIDGVVELLSLIGGFPGNTLETHKLAWRNHKDGVFSVNRLYNWGLRRSAGRSTGPCVTGVGAL
ncbi:hypothetical protein H5410_050823 [Solanum commersonii]|uniref:Uncharacterized protein n=1 Tax=Solanum commersonii TaxID=4109 RepID=A0A9J5WYR2_SOLCO|nr:hypothetical protein H5410_050823 [Solanum commersonii]